MAFSIGQSVVVRSTAFRTSQTVLGATDFEDAPPLFGRVGTVDVIGSDDDGVPDRSYYVLFRDLGAGYWLSEHTLERYDEARS